MNTNNNERRRSAPFHADSHLIKNNFRRSDSRPGQNSPARNGGQTGYNSPRPSHGSHTGHGVIPHAGHGNHGPANRAPIHSDSRGAGHSSSMPGLQHNAKRTLKNTRRMGPSRRAPMIKTKGSDSIPPLKEGTIRVIPLGGVEEVGKNMMMIEYKNDIIVIDAGIQFKNEDTPGIDYILPNTQYLEERRGKIRALIITHGHLDHIGGIPYLIEKLGNPPIYTREFGALLIKKRQVEFPHLPELNIKIAGKNDGFIPITPDLKLKFFGLTHSIPDSTGVIINTPLGDIVNTGDVRVENDNGVVAEEEVEQYKEFKDRNVLLLTMDSTGVEKPGWTISEKQVIKTIDKIVGEVPGRLIIATFASQVERIISFINMAKKYGKKLVIEGRSMKNNVEVIKFLKLAEVDHIIDVDDIADYPPHKLMFLATGAQGEEFAALMRMSNNTHKQIKLNKTDTIILSSSVIPGNERAITGLKDNLFRHDSKIITYHDSDVHASGHGKREELGWILRNIPHRFFMPVHGHHFMLKMNSELAQSLGTPKENIVVPDNGVIIEISAGDKGPKINVLKEKAPSGLVMVDGFSIGDVQEVVIRDRQMLAQDGMFVIIASINTTTGRLKKSPDIISRGFVYLRESQELLNETRHIIKKTIEQSASGMKPIDFDYVKNNVTDAVTKYLFQKTAKKPMVIPVIIGV
jgi:ribonuclease J